MPTTLSDRSFIHIVILSLLLAYTVQSLIHSRYVILPSWNYHTLLSVYPELLWKNPLFLTFNIKLKNFFIESFSLKINEKNIIKIHAECAYSPRFYYNRARAWLIISLYPWILHCKCHLRRNIRAHVHVCSESVEKGKGGRRNEMFPTISSVKVLISPTLMIDAIVTSCITYSRIAIDGDLFFPHSICKLYPFIFGGSAFPRCIINYLC